MPNFSDALFLRKEPCLKMVKAVVIPEADIVVVVVVVVVASTLYVRGLPSTCPYHLINVTSFFIKSKWESAGAWFILGATVSSLRQTPTMVLCLIDFDRKENGCP
ncbi:hypothetical protein ElyMa_000060400 [Elysia marginata]|uniref:G-protein coupled receptors family 1 profile domain-containing protein n=1 Tax=Elysia marginata TaxID=1093978 RepID=A0AAV4EGE9_9GAST|nr:hypothetical protein ElyMa_000060400 [Elysia marginata]